MLTIIPFRSGAARGVLRFALIVIVAIASLARAGATPLNVVMIISDDQGWTDYGFMGSEIRTPNLDKLAAGGALFTRGYTPCSLCRCSLATIITGLYAHQHGITSNDPPKNVHRHGMLKHIEAARTLPALLAARGYRSLQTGKWWEGAYQLGGFTDGMTHGDPERGGRHGDDGLTIGREGIKPIANFLIRRGDAPFFIWYAPMLPHTPHNPPARLMERYAREGRPETVARYMAMCEWFDETVGELMALLESRDLLSNTLIVFAADNGWIQDPNGPMFDPRSKRSPYDGGLRTPIILSLPGRVKPARDEKTLVTTLDLAPTILKFCGLEPNTEMPGLDLGPTLTQGRPPAREAIFGEVFTHDAKDLDRPAASLLFRWTIEGDWKLILPRDPKTAPELYQITKDPAEMNNLVEDQPERVNELRGQINAWWDGN